MSENVKCYVFRTSGDYPKLVNEELKNGRLRQGWSRPGTSLLDTAGEERQKAEWETAYKGEWGADPRPRLYSILRRMLNMNEGDLVVCPKVPDHTCFTIATVNGRYRFEETEVAPGKKDLGHIIPVKDRLVVKNRHDSAAQTIHELFRSPYFWSPVVRVQDSNTERVLEAAKRLRGKKEEETCSVQALDAIIEERYADAKGKAKRKAAKELIQENWQPPQFEAAVGKAFEEKGYKRIGGNSQSGEVGADADHVFAIPMPGFEDLDNVPCPKLLIVQVKCKKGVDTNDVDGVEQLSKWDPPGEEEPVKVLFSSADDFTEKCRKRAAAEGVTLICGEEAGLFLL